MPLRGQIDRLRQLLERLANDSPGPVKAGKAKGAAEFKKTRSLVNDHLDAAGLDGNKSFTTFGKAINAITAALDKGGLELDDVPSADLFKGDSGRRTLRVAWSNPEDVMAPESIGNTMLVIAWYKHQSGNYEVTAYLS